MLSIISCLVIGIADGDTITCLDKQKETHKIRLAEIDAPEKKQDYGQKSKENLERLIYRQNIKVNYETKDRYNRIVGYIIKDGQDINKQQLADGLAWFYTDYGHKSDYKMAQDVAKENKKGLWASSNYMPPWEYRKNEKGYRKSFSLFKTQKSTSNYQCVKKNCKQISNCDEARYLLKHCEYKYLDGNNDGIPCNQLCK